MVPTSKIRIKLTAFDHRVLIESVDEIVKTAKRKQPLEDKLKGLTSYLPSILFSFV